MADADADPALAPQPGLGQLDRLVERVGQAGLPIDLRIDGTPRQLPPGLDLTAYRIVQEALTNALKYAGGAQTQVRIEFDASELLGMQQRVAIYGGQLEAGQRSEGGFAVRARLPLQPV